MGKHGNQDNGRKEKRDPYYDPKHKEGVLPPLNYSCEHENTVYIAGDFHCNSCGETV